MRRPTLILLCLTGAMATLILCAGMAGAPRQAAETIAPKATESHVGDQLTLGDLNCDGTADVFDIDAFIMALLHPDDYVRQYPGCDPMAADCNCDGTTDVFDIDAFIAIITGSPAYLLDYGNSGCLGTRDLCGEDEFELTVSGSTLHVCHLNAMYNCCPDDVLVGLEVVGNTLYLVETEIIGDPCNCDCCYNVDSTVAGLAAGTYEIEYSWFDYGTWEMRVYSATVEVE